MSEPATDLVDLSGVVRFRGHFVPPIGGGGGLQIARLAVGPDVVGYDAAALAAGIEVFTPEAEAFIYDLGIMVKTPFDGTSPLLDVGTFGLGSRGVLGEDFGSAVDGTIALVPFTDNAGLLAANFGVEPVWFAQYRADNATAWPILVAQTGPFLVVGSQDGRQGGTPLDSTVGEAIVVVLYAPPPTP